MEGKPKPDRIMEVGMGFMGSKVLLTAAQLDLFTEIEENNGLSVEDAEERLGLHSRSSEDFLDALVALGLLEREENIYKNTSEASAFLVQGKPSYLGGLFQLADDRLYNFWGELEKALKTGEPTNELESGGEHPFEEAIYGEEDRLERFF